MFTASVFLNSLKTLDQTPICIFNYWIFVLVMDSRVCNTTQNYSVLFNIVLCVEYISLKYSPPVCNWFIFNNNNNGFLTVAYVNFDRTNTNIFKWKLRVFINRLKHIWLNPGIMHSYYTFNLFVILIDSFIHKLIQYSM